MDFILYSDVQKIADVGLQPRGPVPQPELCHTNQRGRYLPHIPLCSPTLLLLVMQACSSSLSYELLAGKDYVPSLLSPAASTEQTDLEV